MRPCKASDTAPGRDALASRGPLIVLLAGVAAAICPAAMDMYVPALPSIARDFGVTVSTTQLTVTAFLLGLAVGQLIAGPLSDVLGRRRPLCGAILIYSTASLLCAVAPDALVLVSMRLLQGLAAAGGIAVSRAIVSDLYSGAEAARYFSRLMLVTGASPVIAPLIGALLLHVTSWHGVFVVLAVLGLVIFAAIVRFLPETLTQARRRPWGFASTFRVFGDLLGDRVFVGYAITLGLCMSALIAYISGAPFIVEDHYGRSAGVFGLVFSTSAVAMMATSQANARLVRHQPLIRLVFIGLGITIVGGIGLLAVVAGGVGFGAAAACFILLLGSWGFVPPNVTALALTDHAAVAGSAAALLGVFQYGMGSLAAPLGGAAGGMNPVPLAIVILAMGCVSSAAAAVTYWQARRRDGLLPTGFARRPLASVSLEAKPPT